MRAADPLLPLLELPDVRAAAEAARRSIDGLRRHRVLRRDSALVSVESALHGARASAALEGADHSLEVVRAGPPDDPVLQGALRVSAGIGPLVGTWERAPLQVLARLHTLAAGGLVGPEQLGRPVRAGVRLTALARLVAAPPGVPAVVLAAVVHGELLATDPFAAAGGIVARAAERLVIIGRGVDPKGLGVPEVGHAQEAAEYRAALAAYASGTAEGVRRWLLHCCTAVRAGAREGTAICEAVRRR